MAALSVWGESRQTILTDEKGRIVDVVSVLHVASGELLVVGTNPLPGVLKDWIDRFIIMEDIKTTDVSAGYLETILYNLEPESRPFDPQLSGHLLAELWGTEVFFRMVCDFESSSGNVRELQESDFAEQQVDSFEKFRISRAIPAFPSELSAAYNPLEAGLHDLISWTKGCYVGQEVIARLDTYQKMQRRLVRLAMDGMPGELPTPLFDGSAEAGVLTSVTTGDGEDAFVGLGYVKVGHLEKGRALSSRSGTRSVKVMVMNGVGKQI